MFASNEDEDWVYLQPVPPTNTVTHLLERFFNRLC